MLTAEFIFKRYYNMRIIRPWHSWIARPPPKGQVTGSTPVGRTIFPRLNLNNLLLSPSIMRVNIKPLINNRYR